MDHGEINPKASVDKIYQRKSIALHTFGNIATWSTRQSNIVNSLAVFWQNNLREIYSIICNENIEPIKALLGDYYYTSIENEKKEVFVKFPNVIWSSIFVAALQSAESILKQMCTDISILNEAVTPFRDYKSRDNGVQKIHAYLKSCNLHKTLASWDEIYSFALLRNTAVHAESSVNTLKNISYQEHIRTYIQDSAHLYFIDDNSICFNADFLHHAIGILHAFLEEVHSAIFPDFMEMDYDSDK